MWHGEFRDARLAAVYDVLFGWTRADDFFLGIVEKTPRARVLDLGCGAGRLALALAGTGHAVTGVDPAPASLAVARAKPGAERVRWVEGTAAALDEAAFDVAVMTSHVAQFLVTDQEWRDALGHLRRALVPGGRLVFDTRDPRARAWETWNPTDGRRRDRLPDGGWVEVWPTGTTMVGGVVSGTAHYRFSDGQELTSEARMIFRSEEVVRTSLAEAGFAVEQIYGGWGKEPVGAPDGELLVVARR